jgi:hypothetical protein
MKKSAGGKLVLFFPPFPLTCLIYLTCFQRTLVNTIQEFQTVEEHQAGFETFCALNVFGNEGVRGHLLIGKSGVLEVDGLYACAFGK